MENKDIIACLLKSTIDVIGRRTTDTYANVVVSNTIKDLSIIHNCLKSIEIKGTQYVEYYEIFEINDQINSFNPKEIGQATKDFIERLSRSMGKEAGFYFLREIKSTFSIEFDEKIKEIGIDLDALQQQFITDSKLSYKFTIENTDILRYIIKILFEIMDREIGRDAAFNNITEVTNRLSIEYEVLRYVKINDIRVIQNVDVATLDDGINKFSSEDFGGAIQRLVQEINNNVPFRKGFSFIERIRETLNADYIYKLTSIGVNIEIIQLNQILIIKNVLKSLIDLLSDISTDNYAILLVNNVLKKYEERFEFFKEIKIDSNNYKKTIDSIYVPNHFLEIRPSDLGRGIQKIVEDLVKSLGEDAGKDFIERYKKRLGKAYALRIEEMGVNLHLIELKRNLKW